MAANFQISPEQLLVEIEDVLRTAPSRIEIALDSADNLAWRGRAAAAMSLWDGMEGISFGSDLARTDSSLEVISGPAYNATMTALNKARSNLRMRVSGPTNIAIGQGRVFDYFDELRKVIEPARQEIFFMTDI